MNHKHHYLLLQRQGKLLLSQISGESKPVMINDMDVLLLSLCLMHSDKDSVAAAFIAHPWIKKLAANIQSHSIIARIEQLNLSVLFEPEPTNPANSVAASAILPTDSVIPSVLRVGVNLAIEFTADGFAIWSARLDKYVLLSVEWVLLLMAFGDGKSEADVIADKVSYFATVDEPHSIVQVLYAAGLLVEVNLKVNQQHSSIPYFRPKTDSPSKARHWNEMQPDERIPVYFATHMENHFPLALGVLFTSLEHYDNGALLKRFQLIPIHFLEPDELLRGPYTKFGAGVWLFSNYMWSVELNLQISAAVKKHNTKNITIHGGPSTPDYKQACVDFMTENASVDISVHGEGEVAICEIFNAIIKHELYGQCYDEFILSSVTGISFKNTLSQHIVHTAARERMKDVDVIPSPYLSGSFDQYGGRVEAAIIETNRGCPYGCTFCDWGSATNQKVRKFDLERVYQEIEWVGKNGIKVMWIADANFGMYDRDIDIAKHIVAIKAHYGYPQEVVVNYTKNSTLKLVEIIKVFTDGDIISQGIISIQTTDEKTLDVINRKNIRTDRYDELSKIFSQLKLPLSTDLMIGLPGITIDAFAKDLQRYIDMDVSVKAYPTQLLPNSPMADPAYIEKYDIKVDGNNFLLSTFSYTEQDLAVMKAMYQAYVMADGYSLLRYVLRYLQWEHGIKAMEFLQKLLETVNQQPERYPQLSWAVRFFNHEKCIPGGWASFYQQVALFVFDNFAIENNSAFETVLAVSKLSMPDESLNYPLSIKLLHDFASYFNAFDATGKTLSEYPPALFQVSDPNLMASLNNSYLQYDTHQFFWELHSAVARPKSSADFSTGVIL